MHPEERLETFRPWVSFIRQINKHRRIVKIDTKMDGGMEKEGTGNNVRAEERAMRGNMSGTNLWC